MCDNGLSCLLFRFLVTRWLWFGHSLWILMDGKRKKRGKREDKCEILKISFFKIPKITVEMENP